MSGRNARYMVTVNDEIASFLNFQSKLKKTSVSKLIMDLIEEAIDLREDYELSKIADEAYERNKDKPTIPAEEVWRRCGLA